MNIRLLAIVPATLLVLSACGSSAEDSSGDLSGAPLVIGAQALLKGPAAYPQSKNGLEAAVAYINREQNGIGGRPLKLEICGTDGSPESAISCANSFVEKGVPLVIDAFDQSIGAGLPIFASAGIPVVGTLPGTPAADAAKFGQAFYFTGPTAINALGTISLMSKLGAERVSLAITDSPASHGFMDTVLKPVGDALGVKVDAQYAPNTGANLEVLAATQLATKPDVAGVVALPEDSCTGLFRALRGQGFDGKIFGGGCSKFIDELGDDAAGSIIQTRLWVSGSKDAAPKRVAQDLDNFSKAMEAAGVGDDLSARALYAFAGVVNTAKVISGIVGEITPQSATKAFSTIVDFDSFAGPTITCDGKQWPGSAPACSKQALFLEVTKDGALEPVDKGGYADLDPSALGG